MDDSEGRKGRAGKRRLRRLVDGYQATCLISAAVDLGLIGRLAAGPAQAGDLALDLGLDRASLERFLRGLVAIELVARGDDGYELGVLGRELNEDSLMQDLAVLAAREYIPAWSALAHSVRTGESAFPHAFGMTAWDHRERHPELGERFDRVMTRYQADAGRALSRAFDFTGRDVVVDVGGGLGEVLIGVLAGAPGSRGIVFDQPHVAAAAEVRIAAAGLTERCRAIGGSFLDSVPAGGAAYLLRHVLHNWDDAGCARILRNCREAMDGAARPTLLVLERAIPGDGDVAAPDALSDLHMLAVQGGRERSLGEYEDLLAAAGFSLERTDAVAGADLLVAGPR